MKGWLIGTPGVDCAREYKDGKFPRRVRQPACLVPFDEAELTWVGQRLEVLDNNDLLGELQMRVVAWAKTF